MKHSKLIIQAAEDSGYVVINYEAILFAGSLEDCLIYLKRAMTKDD